MKKNKVENIDKYVPSGDFMVTEMSDYIGQAIADGVTELEMTPGVLCCLNNHYKLPPNWDFKLWGMKIKIVKYRKN